jgi:protein-disulfide isomerase
LVTLLTAAPVVIAQAPNQRLAREKILSYVRERFNIPESVKITMTDLRESAFPDYLVTTVTLDDGKDKRSQPLFVSRSMRYLVEGSIFNLGGDARELITRLIALKDQPTQGPASAPVTLVEYSDLECPVCAQLHEKLETEIIPKYGDKLRVVFKEFPLVNIHEWALTGAIAAQCTYQIDPSKYVAFRSLVYKNQETIDASRARDTLLHFGAEAGVDNMKLAACIDSKASLSRVEANLREGEALGINQTPTSFINGASVIGGPPSAELDKIIDQAMRDNK